jgi:hypothetical protein
MGHASGCVVIVVAAMAPQARTASFRVTHHWRGRICSSSLAPASHSRQAADPRRSLAVHDATSAPADRGDRRKQA